MKKLVFLLAGISIVLPFEVCVAQQELLSETASYEFNRDVLEELRFVCMALQESLQGMEERGEKLEGLAQLLEEATKFELEDFGKTRSMGGIDLRGYFLNHRLDEWRKMGTPRIRRIRENGQYDPCGHEDLLRSLSDEPMVCKCFYSPYAKTFMYAYMTFSGILRLEQEKPEMFFYPLWKREKADANMQDEMPVDAKISAGKEGARFVQEELSFVELQGSCEGEFCLELPEGKHLEMVKIPSGTFTMGSPKDEKGRTTDEFWKEAQPENFKYFFMLCRESLREIVIEKDFWIGKYEMTGEQVAAILGYDFTNGHLSDYPQANMTWSMCMDVCNILNRVYHGRLPKGYKFSLPLETQWEYACRAGTKTALNNGKNLAFESEYGEDGNLDEVGWYCLNSHDEVKKGGLKQPNKWGLYDMHGNLPEWCYDSIHPCNPLPGTYFMSQNFLEGECHPARGGGVRENCYAGKCRSASRDYKDDMMYPPFMGFRIALIPEELTPVVPSPFSDEEVRKNAVSPVPREGELSVRLPAGVMLSLEMIPAGEFEMGSPEDEIGRPTLAYWREAVPPEEENAEEFHRHSLETARKCSLKRQFWIGRFELTRRQYASVAGVDLSLMSSLEKPVTQIRWEEAQEFCEKLNVLCADQIPQGYRFAIPKEEQWEYACRAGTTTALNSGKDLTQGDFFCPNLAEMAWFQMNSGEHKRDVGLLKPNAWGLYDMHGNVWEWCVCTTPVDDNPLSKRILRGGSWYDPPRFCRSAMRRWLDEDRSGPDIGFRVALVPVESDGQQTEAKQ